MTTRIAIKCLCCKQEGSLIVSQVPGCRIYEIDTANDWHVIRENERVPLAVSFLCPDCGRDATGKGKG